MIFIHTNILSYIHIHIDIFNSFDIGNAFLVFLSMCSYLGGRAVATNRWNREKFGSAYDKDIKNILPGVF